MSVEQLRTKLQSKRAVVGVIGLGYVGLPLCIAIAKAGMTVIGFDIDASKPQHINSGKSYIKHIPTADVAEGISSGRLSATSDFSKLGEADAIMICVPTPLGQHQDPDLSYIEKTTVAIAKTLRTGQLIILESTTYPGTTVEVVQPLLEETGLKAGRDFYLAFSPEREDPGNAEFTTARIPKVIGGVDPISGTLAEMLYGTFLAKTVLVSSASTAEAVKITENIFRAVNIALVNELKVIYQRMGIDIWEVVDAAKTKPFGYMPFYPGPGLGGHCIPIDPFYLTWKAREYGVPTRFIELAGEINTNMPGYVVGKLQSALDRQLKKGLNGSRILVVGLAYKKDVDDIRESPSLRIIEMIEDCGAHVDYHDPYVPEIPATREHARLTGRKSVSVAEDSLKSYDGVLIATDHSIVDYRALAKFSTLIVDTRNACGRNGLRGPTIVPA